MAMRQYIGARYVPRFMGTLDPTQQYEALDVVDNGSGTSYIARKTVPPGTPLTDNDYWFLYGAASGAIVQLQNDMIQAQNDIDDLDDRIDTIDAEKVSPLSARTFLFMSDSYQVQIGYINFITSMIGCRASIIKAYSGAGFYKHNSMYDDYTFENILRTISPLTTAEKEAITDVAFCVASGNDSTEQDSDLTSAMTSINGYLRSILPNLENIHLYPVGWCSMSSTILAQIRKNMAIYQRIAPNLGWKYIDCSRVMKSCAYFDTTDSTGYHPALGARYQLAFAVSSAIINGSCQYTEVNNLTMRYNMTLPTSDWPSASFHSPTTSVLKGSVRINNNGDIIFNQSDFPLRIDNVSIAAGLHYYDIALDPVEVNRNVLSLEGNVLPLLGFGSNFVVQAAVIIRSGVNDSKLRIYTYSAEAVSGGYLSILSSPTKIL